MAYTSIWMVLGMKDIGKRTNKMARVENNGLILQCMKVIMKKEKSMDMGYLDGLMEPHIKENFKTIV